MYLSNQKPSPIQRMFSRRGFSPKADWMVKVRSFFISTSVVRSVKNDPQTPDIGTPGTAGSSDLPSSRSGRGHKG